LNPGLDVCLRLVVFLLLKIERILRGLVLEIGGIIRSALLIAGGIPCGIG
jgi:hypothetical protein